MAGKWFDLEALGTNVRTEVIAGVTTFLTMAYIIFVNPEILATTGMDHGAVFVATCLAAALGSAIMGLWANWPVAMAPGMGLNAFFAFTVVAGLGFTWQQALGAVFISGLIFLFLSVTGVRRWLIAGIPASMRSAIAAGIGLFLAIIALKSAGVVVASPATLITLGDLTASTTLLAIGGFFLIAALDALRVKGAILIGIIVVTLAAMITGDATFAGIVDLLHRLGDVPLTALAAPHVPIVLGAPGLIGLRRLHLRLREVLTAPLKEAALERQSLPDAP